MSKPRPGTSPTHTTPPSEGSITETSPGGPSTESFGGLGGGTPSSLATYTNFPIYTLDYNAGSILIPGADHLATLGGNVDLRAQVRDTTVASYSWDTSGLTDATAITGASSYRLQFQWDTSVTVATTNSVTLTVTDINSLTESQTYTFKVPVGSGATAGTGTSSWPESFAPDRDGDAGSGTAAITLPAYNPNVPAVVLAYDSLAADPRPMVLENHTIDPALAVPSTVTAQLTFDGTAGSTYHYDTSLFNAGDIQRIALQANATALATGRYAYSIALGDVRSTTTTSTVSGSATVVNHAGSAFGAGWTLAGLERIVPATGGVVLDLGSGSNSLWFASGTGSTYVAPAGDFSTLIHNSNGTYTRTLKDGTELRFNSSGRQVATVDNHGVAITYGYDSSGRLGTIDDAYTETTTFAYNATSGLLDTVTDPAGRVATFAHSGTGLSGVTLPDASTWGYQYDTAGRLTQVTDPNSHATALAYDTAGRVASVTYPGSTLPTPPGVGDASFETVSVGSSFSYNPTGTAWTFSGDSGVAGNGSGFTGSVPTPGGTQAAFLQSYGSFSQSISAWAAGTYTLTFDAAQRPGGNVQNFQVLVDSVAVGTFTPTSSAYQSLTTASFAVGAGSHTITFQGLDTVGGDNTALIDLVTVAAVVPTPPGVGDAGFETVSVGSSYAYNPTGTAWTFSGDSGVAGYGSGFTGFVTPPGGTQVAFLQSYGSFSQSISAWPAGTYTISFDAAKRPIAGDQDFRVLVDSAVVGIFAPTSSAYQTFTTASFAVGAGSHTIEFQGLDTIGGDNTALIDAVSLAAAPSLAVATFVAAQVRGFVAAGSGTSASPAEATLLAEAYSASVDPLGNETDAWSDWDGFALANVTSDPLGHVASAVRDGNGLATVVIDPLNRVTRYSYDTRANVTATIFPDGTTTSATYNTKSRPLTVTNELGKTWTYTYDDTLTNTDRTSATGPLGISTTNTYSSTGQLASGSNPAGFFVVDSSSSAPSPGDASSTSAYDSQDRLTDQTDHLGHTTHFVYDAAGNLTSVTDANALVTAYTYDGMGRLLTVTDPLSHATTYAYDAAGNKTSVTDALGHATTYVYDARNRLATATDALSGVTTYAYDAAGRLTSILDPVGNQTTYAYDAAGRQVTTTDPHLNQTTLTYDPAGQVIAKVDRDGRHIAYAYDPRGRRTSEQWLNSSLSAIKTFTWTYDPAGQLTNLNDGSSALTYVYDDEGRATSVATSGSTAQPAVTLASTYYDSGARATLADNLTSAGTTTYSYDGAARLAWIENTASGSSQRIAFGYDDANRLTTLDRTPTTSLSTTSPVRTTTTYDDAGRPTAISHAIVGGSTLATYAYGYDNADRLTSETNAEGTVAYTYDLTDQLTAVSGARSESYSYDSNGNRTMTGYATGTDNQITAGAGFTYVYDNEGNLVTRTETATANVWTYTWDDRNRLVGVVEKDSSLNVLMTGTYTYDPLDRRIGVEETVGTTTTETWTVYDGMNTYADFDGSGNLRDRYLYGPAVDEILARTSAAGDVAWYLTDRLGSVRDLVDTSGTVIDHVAYDSYGGVTAESSPGDGDRFKFTAREFDGQIDLYYNRARYYNGLIGKFFNSDPKSFDAGDTNLFRYVDNRPVNSFDPTGLEDFGLGFVLTYDRLTGPRSRTSVDWFIHMDPSPIGNSGVNLGGDIYIPGNGGPGLVLRPLITGSESNVGTPTPERPNPTTNNPNIPDIPTTPSPTSKPPVFEPFKPYLDNRYKRKRIFKIEWDLGG